MKQTRRQCLIRRERGLERIPRGADLDRQAFRKPASSGMHSHPAPHTVRTTQFQIEEKNDEKNETVGDRLD